MEERTKVIKLRATEEEYQALLLRSEKPRLAQWIREFCLSTKAPQKNKTPPLDPKLLRQIAAIGNNLNQIAKAIHSKDWPPIERVHILTALNAIDRELALLRERHAHDRKI